jgi:hypothetical protein
MAVSIVNNRIFIWENKTMTYILYQYDMKMTVMMHHHNLLTTKHNDRLHYHTHI